MSCGGHGSKSERRLAQARAGLCNDENSCQQLSTIFWLKVCLNNKQNLAPSHGNLEFPLEILTIGFWSCGEIPLV